MYNEKLNQEWIDKLKRRVDGKSITIVGNSASMFSSIKFGEQIDDSDFVLRFGKGIPYDRFKAYLGSKTDAWFFGSSRVGARRHFAKSEFKIFTISQLNVYKPKSDIVVSREMFDESFQLYRDFFLSGSIKDLLTLQAKINDKTPDNRISQGADCLNFFAEKVRTYKEINLIGFDFFRGDFKFEVQENPRYPSIHPGSSWHCPLVSNGYTDNPHRASTDNVASEELFIRAIPRINIQEMPPVDESKMGVVIKHLRGSEAKLLQKETL